MAMTPMTVAYPGSAPPPIGPYPVMSTPYAPHGMMQPPYSAPCKCAKEGKDDPRLTLLCILKQSVAFYPSAVPMHHRVPGPMIVSHPGYYHNRGCCDCSDGCCLCTW
ncbi:hypothetical protein [Absidia glauca]|uniref:Uncharacterized protein n=1 Tax=Absidia glauca TaxID=4829 RepID=A0A168SWU1_ABSGL|nr:hypothetical protein [Absidia glauca]